MVLPFNLEFSEEKKFKIAVINAAEEIQLTKILYKADSIQAYFPEMDGKLVFKVDEFGKYLRGYWLDNRKHKNIKIPLSAYFSNDPRFSLPASNFITQPFVIDGRWEVKFSPDQKDESNALGIFKTNGNSISGTFQTETGDYRFLDGNISGEILRFLLLMELTHMFLQEKLREIVLMVFLQWFKIQNNLDCFTK